MKIRSEKGYTGIDIAISIIVITIFVSLIAVLIYKLNSESKELELKSEATYLAINEIEEIKSQGFEDAKSIEKKEKEEKGFYKEVNVEDYADLSGKENAQRGIVKKVTVIISYMFQGNEQKVELSTTLSKEN